MHEYECQLLRALLLRLQLLEDALDIRTQQLFRLQKALVLHNGGGGGEGVEGDIDQQGMPQVKTRVSLSQTVSAA